MRARRVSCPQSNSWLPSALGGVAELVEDADDGPAEREIGRQRALELVAAVEEQQSRTAERRIRLARGGSPRPRYAAPPRRTPSGVGARLERAVEVVGADDAQARRPAAACVGASGASPAPCARGAPAATGRDAAAHLSIQRRHGARRLDAPVAGEVVLRAEHAGAPHLVDEQLADLLLLVVHHRRTGDHRVAAAARLAIVVQRQREAVRRRDRAALHLEPRDALAHGARDVEHVVRAGDDVEVVIREPCGPPSGTRRVGRRSSARCARGTRAAAVR